MAQLKDLIVAGASRLIGNLYGSEAHFNGDVLPEENNTYSLGSDTLHWKKLFGNAESASKLIHSPNNSTTFLRGDNQFTNTLDGQLFLTSGNDVALATAGSGVLIIGGRTAQNLTLDNNEIMARNNTTASTLYLNNEGGDIETGSGEVKIKGTLNYSNIKTSGSGNTNHYLWFSSSAAGAVGKPVYDTKLKYNPSTGILYANNIQLTGTIPLENIPKAALERLIIVDNEAKRLQLTTAQVQIGDVVQQTDTGVMYYVIDDTKLTSNDGYQVFKAGEAASVEWSNIKNKPAASTLINLASETATSVLAAAPRPGVTGILPVSHGGTGANSFTQDATIVGNGGNALVARGILKITASAINATENINFTKAGEIGIEITNSQTTNPHKAAFIVGSSGNFGLYDRTKNKWIVYGDPDGNGHLAGEATKATQLSTARKFTVQLNSEATPTFNGTGDVILGVTNTLPVTHGGTGATAFTANYVLVGNGSGAISARSSLQVTNDNISINKPITTDLIFSNSGTTIRQLRMQIGDNDYARIAAGATAANGGWMEIATADDGNEPIYVRQYNNGVFGTIVRTATLLDASGNTSFPGNVAMNSLTIQGATTNANTYNSTNPKLTFMNAAGDQNLQLIYTDYDSIISPSSLTLIGNQGGEHFIAPKVNVGGYINNSYALSASSAIINDWIRTTNATGWYNQTYGGGWYMSDSTWIRAYNNKPVYVSNRIQTPIITINTDKTSHNLYVNGTSRLDGQLTIHKDTTTANINTDNGAAMLRFEVNATEQSNTQGYSIIAAYQTPTASNYNQNLSIYSTGSLYLGAGESADTILKNTNTGTGTENLFLCADGDIRFYPGADGKTHYYTLNTTSFLPIAGNARTLGTSNNRWRAAYIGTADTYGNTSTPIYWNAGVPATINGIHQPLISNTIDVSSYNIDTWYPVTISGLPARGYARLKIAVHLNSGTKPAWSTHNAGFTAIVDMLVTPGGWGTTNAHSICLENNQIFISDSTKPPVGYQQLHNSSNAVFWLRGGGKYFLYTDFIPAITIRTASVTLSQQTIAPTTTYPGINFSTATIGTNIEGNAATATALTSSAGSVTQPIYFSGGKPVQTSYSLGSSVSGGTTSYMAYYSGDKVISSSSLLRIADNTIKIYPTAGSYREGLRIYPFQSWSTIVLGGNDLTAGSGTSVNTWSIHNYNGVFYINKNASSGAGNPRAMATSTGWTFGNTSTNNYALNAASFISDSWVRTKGQTGWYSESYGGGWYMTDSTWIRAYNGKPVYVSSRIQTPIMTINADRTSHNLYVNGSSSLNPNNYISFTNSFDNPRQSKVISGFNGQSYRHWIILLLPYQTATNTGINNYIHGHIHLKKSGANIFDEIFINANLCYNRLTYRYENWGEGSFTPISCTYNGIKYFALKCYDHNNPWTQVWFDGYCISEYPGGNKTDTKPLSLPYFVNYKGNGTSAGTNTIVNTEVNNSISTTLTDSIITSVTRYYPNTNINGNATTASKLTNLTTTDQASSSDAKRYVWFSYNDLITGRPAYSSNFTYRTSTNTLFVPQLCITNSSPGIYYQGTKNTYRMLRFIDNTADAYGNGISIGGGGATIIGGGESADVMANQLSTGGSEIMQIGNDGNIDFYSNLQNGWGSGKHFEMSYTGDFSVPEIIHTASLDVPNNGYILTPKGGRYIGNNGTTTGAIQITLPGGAGPCTMVEFDVIVWTYGQSKRLTYHISGYLYSNNTWNNCNAYAYGYSSTYPLPKVRFGLNSSNNGLIIIGETNSTWDYLRVTVEHINFHYGSKTYNDWNKNWAISIITTLPTISTTIDNPQKMSIWADEATSLRTARSIKTNLSSTSGANFNGTADITPGITGTLAVSHGGTGQTTFTSGEILIGNGTSAIQTRGIINQTSKQSLNWDTSANRTKIPTINTLAYWNGAYQGTNSNLSYCNQGAFGNLATKSTNGSTSQFLRGDGTWATVSTTLAAAGSTTQPIYINSSGQPTNTSYSLSASVNGGTANRLAYYSGNNTISSYSSTAGNATRLWYLSSGVPINSTSTVGGTNQPVYLKEGVVTACNSYPSSIPWSGITGKPNRAGSDSDGGPANTVKGAYTGSGGQKNPNYFGTNKIGFLMMNTTVNNNSNYKDWIIMDCYSGNDVGGAVAFGVNRQNLGAYIMRSAAERTSWAQSAELLGTHNYTTYTVTKTGGGASGTWGISISGNAATATALTSNAGSVSQPVYFTGGKPSAIDWHIGNSGTGEHNANNITYNMIGYYTSNGPGTGVANLGATTTDGAIYAQAYSSSWVGQIAQDYRTGYLYTRSKNNGSWTSWHRQLSSVDGVSRYHFGTTGSTSRILITFNKATSWMGAFTLRLYQSYTATDIQISGYNYGANHWYSPQARIIASTSTNSINVYFGYTDSFKLWVGVIGGNYTGADVFNFTNGYTQVDLEEFCTITNVSSWPGTLQTTVTAYPPWYKNETPNSLTLQTSGTTRWTYDGSAAKTLNIKAGSNVTVSGDANGNVTISSVDIPTYRPNQYFLTTSVNGTTMWNYNGAVGRTINFKAGSNVTLTQNGNDLTIAANTGNGLVAQWGNGFYNGEGIHYILFKDNTTSDSEYSTTGFNTNCYFNTSSKTLVATKVQGAVWNDYAEYRKTPYHIEPGRVVKEKGNGELILATKRLERGCEIISDTFGFSIGETDECKTPIASTGRVLAYPYENRNTYEIGAPVCSGPNGTVSQMTEEEERIYPSRIIGTVSEIPTYEEWGSGHVKVNGRIWIRIR